VQVLSTVPVLFSYWARPEHGHDWARYLNDHLAGVVAAHPRRFIGLGTVPMQAPELAERELTRCVRELGLAGIQIGTHVGERNLDHPALFPVFAAAERLGAAVFVHPWDMLAPERMTKYWMPAGRHAGGNGAGHLCGDLRRGARRLPRLRINFAHGGRRFPARSGGSRTVSGPISSPSTTPGIGTYLRDSWTRSPYADAAGCCSGCTEPIAWHGQRLLFPLGSPRAVDRRDDRSRSATRARCCTEPRSNSSAVRADFWAEPVRSRGGGRRSCAVAEAAGIHWPGAGVIRAPCRSAPLVYLCGNSLGSCPGAGGCG
jgi:hypothetical protein